METVRMSRFWNTFIKDKRVESEINFIGSKKPKGVNID